jgi:dimethylargininase
MLEQCGLRIFPLPVEPDFPDSTFVEDVAVVHGDSVTMTRPGAQSRRGEALLIREALAGFFTDMHEMLPPGLLDGGDVCQIEDHFLIGITGRTNREGAEQLASVIKEKGFTSQFIDIRHVPGALHLKSGISYLGGGRVAVAKPFHGLDALKNFELVRVPKGEEYAANSLRLNDYVAVPAGYPKFKNRLAELGYSIIEVEMSEFQKMDGGLSCLSLRF